MLLTSRGRSRALYITKSVLFNVFNFACFFVVMIVDTEADIRFVAFLENSSEHQVTRICGLGFGQLLSEMCGAPASPKTNTPCCSIRWIEEVRRIWKMQQMVGQKVGNDYSANLNPLLQCEISSDP